MALHRTGFSDDGFQHASQSRTARRRDSAGRPADYVETIVNRAQKATDELGITMLFTGVRHFKH